MIYDLWDMQLIEVSNNTPNLVTIRRAISDLQLSAHFDILQASSARLPPPPLPK